MKKKIKTVIGIHEAKKIYMCVSGFPTLPDFRPDPKHFIVNREQNVEKFLGNVL